jgi:DNA-binding MarR family transcriptional regulator
MPENTYETVLFDVFLANQARQQLIATALEGTELPPEDYPLYVFVGAEGPWTPTGLAQRLDMPLTTVLFRLRRLERRGHAERIPNPDDRRSFLIRLTPAGRRLLRKARPKFRAYAEAVEARLGAEEVDAARKRLAELRESIAAELEMRS